MISVRSIRRSAAAAALLIAVSPVAASTAGADGTSVCTSNPKFIPNPQPGENWSKKDLTGCDFSGKDLTGIDFSMSNLSNAKMDNAVIIGVDLQNAVMDGTSLAGANISYSYLKKALVKNANVTGVVWGPNICPDGKYVPSGCANNLVK